MQRRRERAGHLQGPRDHGVDPHQLVEGTIIAAYAIGADHAFIYIRGEFAAGGRRLERAIAEAYAAGFLGKNILGTRLRSATSRCIAARAPTSAARRRALIESLEGKRGEPRLKPPFPAVVGLYGGPTVVNNVETLATCRRSCERGATGSRLGTEKSKGTKLFCLSGM